MPAITRQVTMHSMEYRVNTLEEDILHAANNDGCRNPTACMENVAGKRCVEAKLGAPVQHYRVDTGQIKFNYDGWRWAAPTPKKAKTSIIKFDEVLNNKRVTPAVLEELRRKVPPHSYTVVAIRGAKIKPNTPERQQQVNTARRRRHAAGLTGPVRSNLRRRVVGSGSV